jgi:hypothetical protein
MKKDLERFSYCVFNKDKDKILTVLDNNIYRLPGGKVEECVIPNAPDAASSFAFDDGIESVKIKDLLKSYETDTKKIFFFNATFDESELEKIMQNDKLFFMQIAEHEKYSHIMAEELAKFCKDFLNKKIKL